MTLSNIKTKSRGFTIVELLIVIVIIAILAAITIVAYNGITNRANESSAKSAANSAVKKAEAYSADDQGGSGSYPETSGALTGATSDKSFFLSGVTFGTLTEGTKPTSPSTLSFAACPTGATGSGVKGTKIGYYNYTDNKIKYITAGDATGC